MDKLLRSLPSLVEVLGSIIELILLASITYCETGNFIDADYFLKKSEIICDFDNDQKNLWSFTRYKTDFALGNFEYNTYLARLEDLSKTISESLNSIILKVNIVFIKLLISSKEKVFNENLIKEIDQIFDLIFKLNIDNEKKYNLINYHSFNLHIYASGLLIDKIGKFQIKKSLNIFFPLDQRIIDVKTIVNVLGLPTKYTLDALTYANENDNKYIRATSLYQLSFYFFILQSSMFNFDQITPLSEDVELNYKKHIEYSSFAYNEFISLQLYKDAYNALTLTYELLQLYKVCYQDTVGEISIENLSEILNAYCKEFGFKEYQSTVLKTLETKERTKGADFQTFLSSNENNIDQIAQIVISSIGLPQERKENVLVDLNNYQYFYKNRLSKDYELIQDLRHTFSTNTYYNERPNCLIECKKCGFKTEFKDDIEKLVELINNHECKKETPSP